MAGVQEQVRAQGGEELEGEVDGMDDAERELARTLAEEKVAEKEWLASLGAGEHTLYIPFAIHTIRYTYAIHTIRYTYSTMYHTLYSYTIYTSSFPSTRRVHGAVACLLLFTYTVFAQQAIRLLNCVMVAEGKMVLRYAGSQECDHRGWQAAVALLVALLVAVPMVPLLLWSVCALSPQLEEVIWHSQQQTELQRLTVSCQEPNSQEPNGRHDMDSSSSSSSLTVLIAISHTSFMRALGRHAMQPFVRHHWHWAAVLVLQRLLTVMCSALATTGVETSIGVALVSLIFLLLQVLARPYREDWVNGLQSCTGVCLVVLAILNSASGAFVSTGFDPYTDGDLALRQFQTILEVFMFLALFPPPLVYAYGYMYARRSHGVAYGTGAGAGSRGRNRVAMAMDDTPLISRRFGDVQEVSGVPIGGMSVDESEGLHELLAGHRQ
jgi:hypothetical protein